MLVCTLGCTRDMHAGLYVRMYQGYVHAGVYVRMYQECTCWFVR